MTLEALTATLAELGVKLSIRLVVDAPRGVMTPEISAALQAHKTALQARLASTDVRGDPHPSAPPQADGATSWDEPSRGQWEPTLDPEPGIISDRPDPDHRLALEAQAVPDLENAPKGTSAPSIAKPSSKGRRKEWSAFA